MTTAPNILSWLGLSLIQASAITPGTVYLAAWAFAFGAVVGSFLNVVIWRMPLGKSVVAPRSRCPKCRSSIRGYDNIPILSWLVLFGKCRDCKTNISGRYPIVEFGVGLLVMLLACVEGLNNGMNLPIDLQVLASNSIWWGWATMGLHAVVLLTLFCQTMILFDGKSVPRKLFAMSIIAAILVPALFAGVRPAAVSTGIIASPLLAYLATTVAGASAGIIIGWLCLPATFNEQQDRLSTVWAFGICLLDRIFRCEAHSVCHANSTTFTASCHHAISSDRLLALLGGNLCCLASTRFVYELHDFVWSDTRRGYYLVGDVLVAKVTCEKSSSACCTSHSTRRQLKA
jgi:prepilin signal peptidase PulO-like enzyme (type II secretory pathway)